MEKMNYISPEVEVLDVVIEKGFATSPGGDGGGNGNTGEFDGEWVPIF